MKPYLLLLGVLLKACLISSIAQGTQKANTKEIFEKMELDEIQII